MSTTLLTQDRELLKHSNDIFALGLGLEPPWKLVDQRLDLEKSPHELHLRIEADRGSQYPCPECGAMYKAHDFKEQKWPQYLNKPISG